MERLRQSGVLGALFIGRPGRDPVIGGCHPEPRDELAIAICNDDGEKLAEKLAAGETVRVSIKVDTEFWDAKPNNVVGEIPGFGPQAHEIVILSAHLDSWHLAEGAIDNGNGSSAILETARALSALDWKPRRTVRFVWFMGEEQGLRGSDAYVAAHSAELDDVVAVINVDMPGSPRRLVTFGHREVLGFLESASGWLRGYELEVKNSDAKGRWSDHAPFMDAGVCTVVLTGELGDGVKHYHTVNDKYEIVDRRRTVQSAAVLGVLVRQLADCPQRPTERLSAEE